MDLYATCDRDGTRLVVKRADQPEFNREGMCYGSDEILMVDKSLRDLPDFPAPGTFKKVKRLSILPLEIEYDKPPFVGRVWACCDEDGVRCVRQDREGESVIYRSGCGIARWSCGTFCLSHRDLESIPNWPAPGERRELRCVPTLNIEWADEPAE